MNTQLNKITAMLTKQGYSRIRQSVIKEPHMGDLMLEWWSAAKGTIIVQYEKGQPGCQTFVDWPTGATFAELEFSLTAKSIKGFDRQLEVTGLLVNDEPGRATIDLDHAELDPASLRDAEMRAFEQFQLVNSAQILRTDWVLSQKATLTDLK